MFDVAVTLSRCPDGAEVFDYGGAPDAEAMSPGVRKVLTALLGSTPTPPAGLYYRARSARRVEERVNAVNLADALVLNFINATDQNRMSAFVGLHGFVNGGSEVSATALEETRVLVEYVLETATNDPKSNKSELLNDQLFPDMRLRPEFDYSDKAQKGRVAFFVNGLLDFMFAEVAVAVLSEVKTVRCANCNNAFFTGLAAGRRIDAKTCSNRCRTALSRRSDVTAPA